MDIRFGSKDSVDVDKIRVLEQPLLMKDAKRLIAMLPNGCDWNLVCIKNRKVTWSYKGSVDEVNNMVYHQFKNFPENKGECPVDLVERDLGAKILRTLRGLLSQVSRTEHRELVKAALKSESIEQRLFTLIKVYSDVDFVNTTLKCSREDFGKFVAFQTMQCLALIKGYEIFDKEECHKTDFGFDYETRLLPNLVDRLPIRDDTFNEQISNLVVGFCLQVRGIVYNDTFLFEDFKRASIKSI